jgi:hypothetical protein
LGIVVCFFNTISLSKEDNKANSWKISGERILSRGKLIGEGATDTSTIKNQHFNFLMFFIFNSMAEVAHEDKCTGNNPFSVAFAVLLSYSIFFCGTPFFPNIPTII